ncbi:MAG: altronate dehydratase family protein [Capsulimonadales bacterium]|nr:altronate dehydratase family protein [Capsulimonadales bacterium]
MPTQARALRVHSEDDVATLLSPALAAGTAVRAGETVVVTREAIPSGHKIALRAVPVGALLRKFGLPFGQATVDIAPGDWVHTHNVRTALDKNETYEWTGNVRSPEFPRAKTPVTDTTFAGYLRADGQVGIRNELWVLCTVGCINRVAEEIARRGHARLARANGGTVDGVYAHTHPYGCAQIGSDLAQTRRALAALATHPNCGGVLLFGLGCENNVLREQVDALRLADPSRLRWFNAQETEDEYEAALDALTELAARCATDVRLPVPASKLVLGMKCGGSDGFSGLTANPLVGILADRHAARGGVSVLTEVPEMFGAERLLMARADEETTFRAVGAMINDFKDYFRRYGEPIAENPSPGNKAGGITTLEEKSLGCVQKGGTAAPVRFVLGYGEPLRRAEGETEGGIALAYGPGNDAVSCTTLACAGAQIVLFTTGRGTPFGTCVPTLKISTNSDLARRKPHWIDFDAGPIAETGADPERLADELLALTLRVASGEETKAERNGCREIALFKDGVTE